MKLTVTIESNNDAFNDGNGGRAETQRILREIAYHINDTPEDGRVTFKLRDCNGNVVGSATFKPSEDT